MKTNVYGVLINRDSAESVQSLKDVQWFLNTMEISNMTLFPSIHEAVDCKTQPLAVIVSLIDWRLLYPGDHGIKIVAFLLSQFLVDWPGVRLIIYSKFDFPELIMVVEKMSEFYDCSNVHLLRNVADHRNLIRFITSETI